MSKLLTAEDILEAQDIQVEDVEVPEWGGHVRVMSLTGTERDELEEASLRAKAKGKGREFNMRNFRARLVAASLVDGQNKKIFNMAQVERLGNKSSAALQRVFDVAMRLSGFSADDVDELVKNSESAPSGASGSD